MLNGALDTPWDQNPDSGLDPNSEVVQRMTPRPQSDFEMGDQGTGDLVLRGPAPAPQPIPNATPADVNAPRNMLADPMNPSAPTPLQFFDTQFNALPPRQKNRVALAKMVAKGKAEDLTTKNLQDIASLPFVKQNMDESKQRTAALIQGLQELEQKMAAPPPAMPTSVNMNPSEIFSTAIGTILSHGDSRVLGAGEGLAANRQGIEYQNAVNADNAQGQADTLTHARLSHELENEQLNQRQLTSIDAQDRTNAARFQQQQAMLDQKQAGLETRDNKKGFLMAKDPGEIQYYAEQLGLDPQGPEVQGRYLSAAQGSVKEWNDSVAKIFKTADGLNEDDRKSLNETRQSIADTWHIPVQLLNPVPTSQALGAARLAEQTSYHNAAIQLAKDKFRFEQGAKGEQLRQGWARVSVAEQNAQTAIGNQDIRKAGLAVREFEASSRAFGQNHLAKPVQDLTAQVSALQAQEADPSLRGFQKKRVHNALIGAQAKLASYQSEMDDLNGRREALQLPDIQSMMPPVQQQVYYPQPTAGGIPTYDGSGHQIPGGTGGFVPFHPDISGTLPPLPDPSGQHEFAGGAMPLAPVHVAKESVGNSAPAKPKYSFSAKKGVDIAAEKANAKMALTSHPGAAAAIKAEFKRRTGVDYAG